jgi:nucleoside-diphosphate-sugar epimerase
MILVMKKILVTGATGFVGANLLRSLSNISSNECYVIVRRNSDMWRIKDIKSSLSGIYFADLADRDSIFELVKKIKPQIVYHVATYGGFPDQTDKDLILKSNVLSTINILDASVSNNVEVFVNTGSSSEYGIKTHPMRETDICEPINFYGITKLAATNYCSMIGKTGKIRVCTLRLFSPYGKLEDPSRLYPSIYNALRDNQRPKLSRPNSVRDFIEIEEVVEIYLKIVSSKFESGAIINVGSGKQKTIEEFYKSIARKMGVFNLDPLWGETNPRANEPVIWEADITKLRTILGNWGTEETHEGKQQNT